MSDPAALQAIFKKAQLALMKFGTISARVASGSMEPIIQTDESVTLIACPDELRRFDIIVYKSDRELVCHYIWHANRILRDEDNQLIVTRGLKSRRNDYPLHRREILGKVISHRLSVWWKIRLLWANR